MTSARSAEPRMRPSLAPEVAPARHPDSSVSHRPTAREPWAHAPKRVGDGSDQIADLAGREAWHSIRVIEKALP